MPANDKNLDATFVTLLTPPGRGAVATVLIDGPAATERVDACFRAANGRPLAQQLLGRIVFGRWGDPGGDQGDDHCGEELVLCRITESRIEIHCHGGQAASAAIVEALTDAGCEQRDWTAQIHATSADPIQAEAHAALAHAPTRRTANILLDQYHGALRRALRDALADCNGGQTDRAAQTLRDVLKYADVGRHLTRPWRIVLAGRPNVGKSSLINALVGYQRAIVFDQPGTTRDVVTATTAVDGWPIELADTAGLRAGGDETDDALEAAGMARTAGVLSSADLVLLVFDASGGWEDAAAIDDVVPARRASSRVLHVANKIDLVGRHGGEQPADAPPVMAPPDTAPSDTVSTSATLGTGIEELIVAIAERLVPSAPPPGTAVPFSESQITAITRAIDQLASNELPSASQSLRQLC